MPNVSHGILEHGTFTVTSHAAEELAKDRLSVVDAVNVLRAGPCVGKDYIS
jgi:hypothetical protein